MAKAMYAKVAGAWQKVFPPTPPPPAYNAATGGTELTYQRNGKNWKRHTFTAAGAFDVLVSAAPFRVCGLGGGGAGGNNPGGGFRAGDGGDGGEYDEMMTIPVGQHSIAVGGGGVGGSVRGGDTTAFGLILTGGTGGHSIQFGNVIASQPALPGTPSSATGKAEGVAATIDRTDIGVEAWRGQRGIGGYDGGNGTSGYDGVLVIEYEIA